MSFACAHSVIGWQSTWFSLLPAFTWCVYLQSLHSPLDDCIAEEAAVLLANALDSSLMALLLHEKDLNAMGASLLPQRRLHGKPAPQVHLAARSSAVQLVGPLHLCTRIVGTAHSAHNLLTTCSDCCTGSAHSLLQASGFATKSRFSRFAASLSQWELELLAFCGYAVVLLAADCFDHIAANTFSHMPLSAAGDQQLQHKATAFKRRYTQLCQQLHEGK